MDYQIVPQGTGLPTAGDLKRQIKRHHNHTDLQVAAALAAYEAISVIHVGAEGAADRALAEAERIRQASGRTLSPFEQTAAEFRTTAYISQVNQIAQTAGVKVLQVLAQTPTVYDDRTVWEQVDEAIGEGIEMGTRWLPGGRR